MLPRQLTLPPHPPAKLNPSLSHSCSLFTLFPALPWAAEVTDSAGRAVSLPDRVGRVMAAGPNAAIVLYVLAPEKMIGWIMLQSQRRQ